MTSIRLVGVDEHDTEVFDGVLPHGDSPDHALWQAGFSVIQPIRADRDAADDIVVRLRVGPRQGSRPRSQIAGRDAGLVLAPGERAEPRQRIAAYGIVRSDRGLLATQYSDRTAAEGRWGLSGGGIDPGEQPRDTVLREVYEETSQQIELGELVAINTAHWIGRNPGGSLEDFHAVRLVYDAVCPEPSDPVIVDVGGTTSQARWIELNRWEELNWTGAWRDLLRRALPA